MPMMDDFEDAFFQNWQTCGPWDGERSQQRYLLENLAERLTAIQKIELSGGDQRSSNIFPAFIVFILTAAAL